MKWALSLLVVFCSCNVSLLVPKTKVIKQASGYLVYRGEECLFFGDDAPDRFFEKVHRDNGSRIYQGCGMDAMKNLATSYPVGIIYDSKEEQIEIADTIKIVPVRIRYLPDKFRIAEKVKVALKYNNKLYEYDVWNIFHGEVLSISLKASDE